jgi:hypothetical protein
MNYVRKTYIEFLYPGSFVAESSTKEVKTREVSKVKVPKSAFGFKFFDILSVVVDADSRKVQLTSERINMSPMHYYGGKLYTLAEVEREFPQNDTLVQNMKGNGWGKVIRCRTGNWQPFEDVDVFVEAA